MMDKKMMKAMMAGKEADPMMKSKIKAKMEVLQELMDMADQSETSGLMDDMQQVTVAAPDKEGLVEGLEKAEDIMGEMPEDMMPDMDMEDEEEDEEDEDM
jgi:hypothetical protein